MKLLWGTANLFSNPRYMNGAATNPDFNVVCHAGAQVRNAIDATIERLGGSNYVFWGGREGYLSLLNTNMKREQEHMARFLHMARDYGRRNGFKGAFLIEPKPMEPSRSINMILIRQITVISFANSWFDEKTLNWNIEVNSTYYLLNHTFSMNCRWR